MIQKLKSSIPEPFYIESDGTPVGETPRHFRNITLVAEVLMEWFAKDPNIFVAGNMFLHYEEGNRLKHLSPDVFVVRGIPKEREPERRTYLVWEEGKGPDFVLEVTSASTEREDLVKKRDIYQDILQVREYVLYDPFEEYLFPPLQGYRLVDGSYEPMEMIDGRLPSEVLGLHLERSDDLLRVYDPKSGVWLRLLSEANATIAETTKSLKQAKAKLRREAKAREDAEEARLQSDQAREKAERKVDHLRRELEKLRKQSGNKTTEV